MDFCLRLPGHLVSVPDAVVHHPLWPELQVSSCMLSQLASETTVTRRLMHEYM